MGRVVVGLPEGTVDCKMDITGLVDSQLLGIGE